MVGDYALRIAKWHNCEVIPHRMPILVKVEYTGPSRSALNESSSDSHACFRGLPLCTGLCLQKAGVPPKKL